MLSHCMGANDDPAVNSQPGAPDDMNTFSRPCLRVVGGI